MTTYCPFTALASDTLLTHGAEAARLLAMAISCSSNWDEFFACARFLRATQAGSESPVAPLARYLDGLHFFRLLGDHYHYDGDLFDACKELAWAYREQHDL